MTGSVTVVDVDAPVEEEQNNTIGTSTSEGEATSNNVQLGLAVGMIALLGAALWRARIYD
jgi:MYXO-CTERM domain-containing protein